MEVLPYLESARLVEKYSDGVDLNCGCPQKWALQVNNFFNIIALILIEPDLVIKDSQELFSFK